MWYDDPASFISVIVIAVVVSYGLYRAFKELLDSL